MRESAQRVLVGLALTLCLLAPTATAKENKKPLLEKELQARVETAIDKGAEWLVAQQGEDGMFRERPAGAPAGQAFAHPQSFGHTALATLTLAHCGYGTDQPVIQRAIKYLRENYKKLIDSKDHLGSSASYSLSILVMALHQLYASPPKETGKPSRYAEPKVNPCKYPDWARELMTEIVEWILKKWNRKALFSYPHGGGMPGGIKMPGVADVEINANGDMSNTQYALLAIWAGTRCGYRLDKKTLFRIADVLLAAQQRTGPKVRRRSDPKPETSGRYAGSKRKAHDIARGFGYGHEVNDFDTCSGSMTTGGLSSLVVVHDLLKKLPKQKKKAERSALKKRVAEVEQAVWDAIAWLGENYTVDENPGADRMWEKGLWHCYYLYGLERACVLAGKRYLAGNDWYADGAKLLVDAQKPDGCWQRQEAAYVQVDTCFAILFLKRAALRTEGPKRPVITGTPGERLKPEGRNKPGK